MTKQTCFLTSLHLFRDAISERSVWFVYIEQLSTFLVEEMIRRLMPSSDLTVGYDFQLGFFPCEITYESNVPYLLVEKVDG